VPGLVPGRLAVCGSLTTETWSNRAMAMALCVRGWVRSAPGTAWDTSESLSEIEVSADRLYGFERFNLQNEGNR
jgi:hypothetical protein